MENEIWKSYKIDKGVVTTLHPEGKRVDVIVTKEGKGKNIGSLIVETFHWGLTIPFWTKPLSF